MQVLVRTDNVIQGSEGLNQHVENTVADSLQRFGSQVVTVHVHLSDTNSHKSGGNDKRCTMEARLAGLSPIAVTHDADSLDYAIDGASDKLVKAIDRIVSKQHDYKGRTPSGGEIGFGGEIEE